MALRAFVARSFDPADEQRINPIRNFLETFRKAGFLCEEAEAAEVESVSVKVRKLIDANDVFVGFFTRKYPVYRFSSSLGGAISLACGKLQPEKWSAPPWVLQESGYAISAGKKVILLREEGVDIPGLQGDLEYVPFDPRDPSAVFSKLSEMIHDLLAKDAGREIKTEITERPEQVEAKPQPPEPKEEEKLGGTDEFPGLVGHFVEMRRAARQGDYSALDKAHTAGKTLIAEGQEKDFDPVFWDCLYFEARYDAGAASGLEALRRMHKESPQLREPTVTIAHILTSAKVHDEAARLYLEAAGLEGNNYRADDLVEAARALNELKRYEEGINAAEESLLVAFGDVKWSAVSVLYQLLKNSGETHLAFATAEAALHENPLLDLRFDLGLDYRGHGLKELALYHFKFLHERNPDRSAPLHNLALLCSDCELPIASVRLYKSSFALGETLSAANLGFMYLDAGMADETKRLVQEAMSSEQHEPRVDECFAEISKRTQNEEAKQSDLLETANGQKDFFVSMGTAMQRSLTDVDGQWMFPFGEMTLARSGPELNGSATISRDDSSNSLAALLAVPAGASGGLQMKIEQYTLAGTIRGAVCEFSIAVTVPGQHSFGSILAGRGNRQGFIVFAADGRSATYSELKDKKLGTPAKILRIEKQ